MVFEGVNCFFFLILFVVCEENGENKLLFNGFCSVNSDFISWVCRFGNGVIFCGVEVSIGDFFLVFIIYVLL